jgi:hypothetical protein
MQVYPFASANDTTPHGFALEKDGGGLPVNLGPWIPRALAPPESIDTFQDEVATVLKRDGVYVQRGGVTIRRERLSP